MNRLVMNKLEGRVEREQPVYEPPVYEPPQRHVWYMVRGVWYPVSRETAQRRSYPFETEMPEGPRCEDWQRRIEMING